jgi:pimeloyl-ACP methyl ester carboxylesterase
VKVEDTFKVTERIPGHTIYLVPNTGHLAHEEDPEDFLRVVKRFIETRVEV